MASPIKPTSWFLRNSVVDSVPNAVVCSVSLSTVDMQAFHCFYWRLGFCSLLQQRLAGLVEDEPRENSNCSFQSKQLLIGNVSQESYKENTRLQIIEGTRFAVLILFLMQWCGELNPTFRCCSDLKPYTCMLISKETVVEGKIFKGQLQTKHKIANHQCVNCVRKVAYINITTICSGNSVANWMLSFDY